MKTYNKLVRDKIPEIINKQGEIAKIEILSDEQYLAELYKKLQEEITEFKGDPCEEELADIFEVLDALKAYYRFSGGSIEKIKSQKRKERGGFDDRIFLKTIEK
ncbi:nucleoside triphosphate pyrophosphohydrolase [Candidatus Dojkabacteria bacterium]|uniref:Nucleoside triphosphate pyrophosphohydrolase n=1 Tax=Candidatus Dojkabacteria bacterium TaxID=2099670 RepID=A0A955RKY2_9BACT|nr:nucleoside triphosphate pyrophosphohydrolase [Candidatus Dojkabacteria bacterium]